MNATDICNLALGKIGDQAITSLDDATPAARWCKIFYEPTRDEVLSSHGWNFAIKQQVLTQDAATPAFTWSYQYSLPNDCLRVIEFNNNGLYCANGLYVIEGRKLLTNDETAEIRFIAKIDDESLFAPLFTQALACKLAANLARPVAGANPDGFLTEYTRLTGPDARAKNAIEGNPGVKMPYALSNLVKSRRC